MSIASKEAHKTRYWLRLLKELDIIEIEISGFLNEIEQLIKILTKIVKTSQENL
jgi:four helix bundle protein